MLTPVEGVRRVVSLSQPTDPAERAGTASGDGDRGARIRRAQAGRQKARVSKIARARIGKARANVLFLSPTSVTTTFTDERKQSCNSG